ncbi:MAG: XRE family transcriptional regulator [Chitinophagaceae bacterium]|nr:MAG: XRE family transcriptional regulator [Chitinophagaceae bacterium]
MSTTAERTIHLGRKIERMRELRGMKQETLAQALGITQQAVSKMEGSEQIDPERLEKVAGVLGVSVEAIRNFSEEALFNNINNVFHDHSALVNYQFNPIDKIVELYERLLKSEQEKVEMLQSLLEKFTAK